MLDRLDASGYEAEGRGRRMIYQCVSDSCRRCPVIILCIINLGGGVFISGRNRVLDRKIASKHLLRRKRN